MHVTTGLWLGLALAGTVLQAAESPMETVKYILNNGLGVAGIVATAVLLWKAGKAAWPEITKWLDADIARRDKQVQIQMDAVGVQARYADALVELRGTVDGLRTLQQATLDLHRQVYTEIRARPCLLEQHRVPLPQVPPAKEGGQ